jgi:hypothetical protein
MADLGRPELAFDQAQRVTRQNPAGGVAWAVLAYNYADRDEPLDAFTDLLAALKRDAKTPFVLRTAGQLLAWYDSDLVERDTLAGSLRADVGSLKIRYGDNEMFALAYAQAARTYAGTVLSDITAPAPTALVQQEPPPVFPRALATGAPPYMPEDDTDNVVIGDQSYGWPWYGYYQPWWCYPYCGLYGQGLYSSGYRHHHHGFSGLHGGGVRMAGPPGVNSAKFQALAASGGAARTFSTGYSSSLGATHWFTGGSAGRSASFGGFAGGRFSGSSGGRVSGSSGHWSGGYSGRSSSSFTGSGGSRSYGGGFQSGTYNYGGGRR